MPLGEVATREINDSKGEQSYDELADSARTGGGIASDARQKIEAATGKKAVSRTNYLTSTEEEQKEIKDGN